jgi:hypothetical protein
LIGKGLDLQELFDVVKLLVQVIVAELVAEWVE